MEARIRILLLTASFTLLGGCAYMPWHKKAPQPAPATADSNSAVTAIDARAAEQANGSVDANGNATPDADANQPPPQVIQPVVERRRIKVPKIKADDIELGGFYGSLSIEDFGTNPVYGFRFDYHITEDFFFEALYGQSTAGQTSFETLGGNVQLLTDAERRFTYYNLSLGYNLLPGEIFLGSKHAMNSALYLIGGIGSVRFAGDQNFAANFGAGFRVLPTDWLALHIDMQDIVFNSDLLGVNRLKNNLQAHIGFTFFF
ncbi:MAG TPA: outer membrane beta-barrel domain-containing protein [Steroidobacteraceae bacterium]|nr:outer membrane beta-barrel domain-containing protein [Steroidobacteraceae bacterium]